MIETPVGIFVHRTLTRPELFDHAPYLTAFVASSWKIRASPLTRPLGIPC
jgi:hypothetical protein